MGNLPCPHRHLPANGTASASSSKRGRRISIAEVEENGWLIIFGKVYNVKDYLRKHPGGQDILLGLLGRDATVEFETMRHSEQAFKQLEQLMVGSYDTSAESQEEMRQHEALRKVGLTGGRETSGDSGGANGAGPPALWDVRRRGFLPSADPVKELPPRWENLVRLTDFIPSLGVQGRFRELAAAELENTMPKSWEDNQQAIQDLSEGQLESLHSMLGYICLAYLHSPPDIYEQDAERPVNIMSSCQQLSILPPWLSRPWLCVSEKLERRPMLDYAGCVLNNWERIDPSRPLVPSNLRLLRRFTGLVDEEWFFKTHIVIEAEGSHVVSSLEAISRAVQSKDEHVLLEELHTMEQNLWRLSSVCLPIMFARSPRDHSLLCEPFLFFFRLRNYIKSMDVKMMAQDDTLQDFHLHGPSGAMSSILPAVDALLGIRNTSAELREAVKKFEDYVPKAHRIFLDHLRNLPESVKSFIETRKETIDESTWFALAAAFNSCISRVLDFRWRHWSFVEQFIVRPSSSSKAAPAPASVCPVVGAKGGGLPPPPPAVVGTGGTTFDYLQQHITDSQRARIPLGITDTLLLKTPEVPKKLRPAVDISMLEPLDDATAPRNLWEPSGPNGFAAHRTACLPKWGSQFLKAPSPACQALVHLAGIIPNVCYTYPGLEHMEEVSSYVHPFVSKCEASGEVLGELLTEANEMQLVDQEHAWLLLTFVACAYRSSVEKPNRTRNAQEPRRQAALRKLPSWLCKLVLHFEELLGREWHGSPEYTELVLNNWASSQESTHDFIISRETIHQIQPIARFIAMPDEEWYRKLHLVLEAEGGRAISAAQRTITPAIAMRDTGAVIAALNQLAQDVDSLSNFQMQQFDQKDSRGEAVMMQRLRAFVAEDLSEEDYAVWVYAEGSSPLLPALHAILGLRKLDGIAGPLQEHWQMQGRRCMPKNHRDFLDQFEQGISVRAYCLREWRKASVEGIAALEDAFNNCIEALLRYCSLRQRLVSRMFPDVSRIRLMNAEQEQVIRTGRLALLQMRRLADSHRMLLSRAH